MPDRHPDPSCPYCHEPMTVTRMACPGCKIQVEGDFGLSRLGALPIEHQRFIELFVLAGGSLKEIAEQTGVSYPTVRSRLDKIIAVLSEELRRSGGGKTQPLTLEQKAQLIKNM